MFQAIPPTRALCSSKPRLSKFNRNEDFFRHTDPHDPAHDALLRVDINEAFMDAHLPPVPGGGPLAAGGLEDGHAEPFGGKGDRSGHFHPGFFGDGP